MIHKKGSFAICFPLWLMVIFVTVALPADADRDLQLIAAKPKVALIYSRECPVCAKVMPELKALAISFAGKVNFVYLDVTDNKATEKSKELAKALHIGAFFSHYSESFPVVGIFDKDNKQTHELSGFNSKERYASYISRAL